MKSTPGDSVHSVSGSFHLEHKEIVVENVDVTDLDAPVFVFCKPPVHRRTEPIRKEKRQRRNQWIPAQGRNDGCFSRSMKKRVGRGASRSARLPRQGSFTNGPYENRGKGRGHKTGRTRRSPDRRRGLSGYAAKPEQ